MANVAEAINVAVQRHQAGQFAQAEALYRQILAIEPLHADALHLLGVVVHQIDARAEAADWIHQAIQQNPRVATFYDSLGTVLKFHKRWDEAAVAYQRAVALNPQFVEAHNHLGLLYRASGRPEEAVASFQRVLQLDANNVDALCNWGGALIDQKRYGEAVIACRRAIELKPNLYQAFNSLAIALNRSGKLAEALATLQHLLKLNPEFAAGHCNLGNVWQSLGRSEEARAAYHRAIEIDPTSADGYNGLGNVAQEAGQCDEAIERFRRALELRSNYPEAWNNLGNALTGLGQFDEAIKSYRESLRLRPDFSEAHVNLAAGLKLAGRWPEAAAAAQRSLDIHPDFAAGHCNLAHALLGLGEWPRGWQELEWRWQTNEFSPRPFPQPMWSGESLAGKTILLHAEQGLGDTIQFVRYAQLLKQQNAMVVVESQRALLPLLASYPFFDRLIGQGDALPSFDCHLPLMSLPRVCGTTLASIPAEIPYLYATPTLINAWRERLKAFPGFKIGINWQGNPKLRHDRFRSIPLRYFAPLSEVPGVHLISLQQQVGEDQLDEGKNGFPVTVLGDDVDQAAGPFMDTAAVMKNLDLIVTSDTATAHLAGALGVPVWVALPFAADWRWLERRPDSPWYPTMRLFRQPTHGNWDELFQEIKQTLLSQEKLSA